MERANKLVELISAIKGCQFANITALTNAEMNKRHNPFYGRVQKLTSMTIQLNYSYENAVNRHLSNNGLEENFVADKLTWGEWLIPNKIIAHKGEMYLRTYVPRNAKPIVIYLLDGRKATDEEINAFKSFLKQSTNSKKQSKYGLEDDEQVKPRTFSFESIQRLHTNGVIWLKNNKSIDIEKWV